MKQLDIINKFSTIKAYENKSGFYSCYMCKNGLTERCILLEAQLGCKKKKKIYIYIYTNKK